jgi:hypothetical protein
LALLYSPKPSPAEKKLDYCVDKTGMGATKQDHQVKLLPQLRLA